jgi:hypothetical protein
MPLKRIANVLSSPAFDTVKALESHREHLTAEYDRLTRLIRTLDRTIGTLVGKNDSISDANIYEGFTDEVALTIRRTILEKYGEEELSTAEAHISMCLGEEGLNNIQERREELNIKLASLMGLDPADAQVQSAIELHYNSKNEYFKMNKKMYRETVEVLAANPAMVEYLDGYRKGARLFCPQSCQDILWRRRLVLDSS